MHHFVQHSEVTFNAWGLVTMKVTMENIQASGLLFELYFSFNIFSFVIQKLNVLVIINEVIGLTFKYCL